LFALALHTIGCTVPDALPAQEETSAPVIGGTVDNGDPSVAYLYVEDGQYGWSCTASLISPTVLLTAAHCTHDAKAGAKMWVHFETTQSGATWHKVKSWKHHPSFVSSRFYDGYDIAVVVLEQPAAGRTPLPYARTAPQQSWVGQNVRVVGYGNTNGAAGTGGGTKREATTTFNGWDSLLIEVGYTGKTTCQGDSGGPTFKIMNGVETIIGVTSFGEVGCTNNGSMSRVDAYVGWIDAQLGTTPPPVTPPPVEPPPPPPPVTPPPPAAPNCPWEGEDNGSSATANALCSGSSIYGSIDRAGDVDWYTWTVQPNKTYRVWLTAPPSHPAGMTLYKLSNGTMSVIDTTGPTSGHQEISRSTTTGGTYYLKVSGTPSPGWGYSVQVMID
jgi:V8-like Glu-specific endopeptidase